MRAVWRGRGGRASMGLVLLASSARGAEIDWSAPAECPDAEELRFRVERAIGMPLGHAAPLRFQARAEASPRGYEGRVMTETAAGKVRARDLTAPDCAGLADMVTVSLALALGAEDVEGTLEGPSADALGHGLTGAAAPEPAPTRDVPASGQETQPSSARVWPGFSAWLVGDGGSLPRPGAGVALGAQLESTHVELRALGTWLFEQQHELALEGEPVPGAEMGLATGALLACARPFAASASGLSASGCVGWELGGLWGQGIGVPEPRSGVAFWSAPRLDVGASWALGGSGLRLGAQLTVALPLTRDEFVLGELGSVHQPPAAVGRVALGLGWSAR